MSQTEDYELLYKKLSVNEIALLFMAYNNGGSVSWDRVDVVKYDFAYRSLIDRKLIMPSYYDAADGFFLLPKGEQVIEDGSPTSCGVCGQELYCSEASVDSTGDVIMCRLCDETFYDNNGRFLADRS